MGEGRRHPAPHAFVRGTCVSLASTASHGLRIPLLRGHGVLVVAVIYAGLAISVVYPLLAVFVQALFEGAGLSFAKVHEVFTTPNIVQAVVNTLVVSVLTVVLAAGIGVTLAWLIARSNIPFKRVLDPLNMIPFYLSSVVGALSWQVIAAPRTGLLNSMLAPLFSDGTWPQFEKLVQGYAFADAQTHLEQALKHFPSI